MIKLITNDFVNVANALLGSNIQFDVGELVPNKPIEVEIRFDNDKNKAVAALKAAKAEYSFM